MLTTHRLSLPEVGGDAVAYTEPDSDAIAPGPRAPCSTTSGGAPTSASAGLARAREFTWAASAEAHLASYARALAE